MCSECDEQTVLPLFVLLPHWAVCYMQHNHKAHPFHGRRFNDRRTVREEPHLKCALIDSLVHHKHSVSSLLLQQLPSPTYHGACPIVAQGVTLALVGKPPAAVWLLLLFLHPLSFSGCVTHSHHRRA
ncbi:unnamed protein product [Discosporangium mesarthrocarpum]